MTISKKHTLAVKFRSPIIIVGLGGSGSSLLNQILGSHPQIDMKGETNFLLAKAWAAFSNADANTHLRNLEQHFNADPELETRITTSHEQYRQFLRMMETAEFERRGAVIRKAVAEWFCLDESPARFWGFKEIWNGSAAFRHKWDCYDYAFPEAIWVHNIRHPLQQVRAAGRLSGSSLSTDFILTALRDWVGVTEMSRHRAATGRYYEIRYEQLRSAPEQALSSLLNGLGLDWHDECRLPLLRHWGARSAAAPLPANIGALVSATSRLPQIMHAYRYRLEDTESNLATRPAPATQLESLGKDGWKLCGPFLRESGKCWEIDLSTTAIAEQLARVADDVGSWSRSPLRLFENGKALRPHALHFRIRADGGGIYSHWQHRLLFATSDNSSPNSNARVYSFDLKGSAD